MPKSNADRQKLNQYIDWLSGKGCQFNKMKIRLLDVEHEEYVVMANRDIHKDETIMFIPESMCILPENLNDVPANSWLNWNEKSQEKIKNKS